jgi:hypothetical protein
MSLPKILLCLLGAVLGILSSCGPDLSAIPEADDAMALAMGVEKAELERGRTIYMAHCQKCHPRVPPGKIDPEAWREILPHMSQNAKLRPAQYADLQLYLIAAHGTVHRLDLQH